METQRPIVAVAEDSAWTLGWYVREFQRHGIEVLPYGDLRQLVEDTGIRDHNGLPRPLYLVIDGYVQDPESRRTWENVDSFPDLWDLGFTNSQLVAASGSAMSNKKMREAGATHSIAPNADSEMFAQLSKKEAILIVLELLGLEYHRLELPPHPW